MLRFVDMRQADIVGVRFGFWDTVRDRMLEVGGDQGWFDLRELEDSVAVHYCGLGAYDPPADGTDEAMLARLKGLCPAWASEGEEPDADADYYILDARSVVGNCALWWRPKGKGYTCDINDAGLYTHKQVFTGRRITDVPVHRDLAWTGAVTHVRIEKLYADPETLQLIQAARDSLVPDDDECPGEGECHGAQRWCAECGDVDGVCNDSTCDLHGETSS